MNMRQYAEYKQVSPATISQWVKAGILDGSFKRLAGGRYEFDPAAADALLDQHSATCAPGDDAEQIIAEQGLSGLTMHQAKLTKERYLAALRKLEYEERSGQLIPVDQVSAEAFECARQVRDAMLSIPQRLSAQLAATTDQNEIHNLLSAEIRQALEALSS